MEIFSLLASFVSSVNVLQTNSVCVRACVRVRVRACVRACVCVHACVCVCARSLLKKSRTICGILASKDIAIICKLLHMCHY